MMDIFCIARRIHILALKTVANHRQVNHLPQGRVVILAPHPDDETLGCGGLIARLCREGRAPYVVILTGGEASHKSCCGLSGSEIAQARHELTLESAQALGLPKENIITLGLHDGTLSKISSDIRLKVIERILSLEPDVILLPHSGEGWPDHIAVREIGYEAAEMCGASVWEYAVWMWYYNVWRQVGWCRLRGLELSPTEFAIKRKAVNCYVLPKASCGTPWSGNLPKLLKKSAFSDMELYFI